MCLVVDRTVLCFGASLHEAWHGTIFLTHLRKICFKFVLELLCESLPDFGIAGLPLFALYDRLVMDLTRWGMDWEREGGYATLVEDPTTNHWLEIDLPSL